MKYIYTYLDAVGNDTEMGPYSTRIEAEDNRRRHEHTGALTMPIREVADEYKPFKPQY